MRLRRVAGLVLAVGLLAGSVPGAALASGASTATAPHYRNCTALNKVHPHGVGKPGARDKVSGKTRPVTTFKKSLALYAANAGSDRDRDGIACEKL